MGAAKRRGTYEQRKAQKLASQYGLTNAEIALAYQINKKYNLMKLYRSSAFQRVAMINNTLNYYI